MLCTSTYVCMLFTKTCHKPVPVRYILYSKTYMYLCCQGDQHSVSILHAQHECERFLTHFLLHGLTGEATSSFLNQPTLSRCTAHEHPIIVLISLCKLLASHFLPCLLPLHSSGISHEQSCLLHGLAGEATSSFLNQPTYSVSFTQCINFTTTQSSCMGACVTPGTFQNIT